MRISDWSSDVCSSDLSKSATPAKLDLVLEPDDAQRLVNLCGPFDAHLRQIELRLGIEIRNRGNRFQLVGARKDIGRGEAVLQQLFNLAADDTVTTENVDRKSTRLNSSH